MSAREGKGRKIKKKGKKKKGGRRKEGVRVSERKKGTDGKIEKKTLKKKRLEHANDERKMKCQTEEDADISIYRFCSAIDRHATASCDP